MSNKYNNTMQDYLNFEVDPTDTKLISVIDELPLWSAPFGIKLLDLIKYKKGIHGLDIGCGLGFPLIELSQRLDKTCRLFGIDPWKEAINRAQQKIDVYKIKNIELLNITAEELPFADDYFDLIVSNNGINNVQNLEQVLGECKRVLKANSQFVFSMNTNETMVEFYSVFEDVLKQLKLEQEIKKMNDHIYSKRRPISEITVLVKNHDFAIKEILFDKFTIKFSDGTTMFNHYLIKYWFLDGWKSVLKEPLHEEVFSKVENEINRLSETQGEFCLTIPFAIFDCVKD